MNFYKNLKGFLTFPAQVLEECCQPGLAGRLPATWPASQHQLWDKVSTIIASLIFESQQQLIDTEATCRQCCFGEISICMCTHFFKTLPLSGGNVMERVALLLNIFCNLQYCICS